MSASGNIIGGIGHNKGPDFHPLPGLFERVDFTGNYFHRSLWRTRKSPTEAQRERLNEPIWQDKAGYGMVIVSPDDDTMRDLQRLGWRCTEIEIAQDRTFPWTGLPPTLRPAAQMHHAYDAFFDHPHHRHQLFRYVDPVTGTVTTYTAPRRSPLLFAWYVLPGGTFHIEARLVGAAAVRRAEALGGRIGPGFDHLAFWDHHERLLVPDLVMLGRLLSNRLDNRRRRLTDADDWAIGLELWRRLGRHRQGFQSVQALITHLDGATDYVHRFEVPRPRPLFTPDREVPAGGRASYREPNFPVVK